MIINSLRSYQKDHTDGKVYVDGVYFGYSLEDAGRPAGVKIPKETAIPEGTYTVKITYSPAFKREMIVLFNDKSDHSINRHGVRFTGIRVHGGNNIEHTAGCVMVAKNSDGNGTISGSLERELAALVQAAIYDKQDVYWVISES